MSVSHKEQVMALTDSIAEGVDLYLVVGEDDLQETIRLKLIEECERLLSALKSPSSKEDA